MLPMINKAASVNVDVASRSSTKPKEDRIELQKHLDMQEKLYKSLQE